MSPATLDRLLAAALLAIGEAEVWFTGDAGGHRLSAALVAPVLQACLALRRRYPLAAGLVAEGAEAIQFGISSNTQIIANKLAWQESCKRQKIENLALMLRGAMDRMLR